MEDRENDFDNLIDKYLQEVNRYEKSYNELAVKVLQINKNINYER